MEALKRKIYRCGNLYRPLLDAGTQPVLAIEGEWARSSRSNAADVARTHLRAVSTGICVLLAVDADQAEAICQRLIDMLESGLPQARTVCWRRWSARAQGIQQVAQGIMV